MGPGSHRPLTVLGAGSALGYTARHRRPGVPHGLFAQSRNRATCWLPLLLGLGAVACGAVADPPAPRLAPPPFAAATIRLDVDVAGDRILTRWTTPDTTIVHSADRALVHALARELLSTCADPDRDPTPLGRELGRLLVAGPVEAAPGSEVVVRPDPTAPEVVWTAVQLPHRTGWFALADQDLRIATPHSPRAPHRDRRITVATRSPRTDARGRAVRVEEVDVLAHLFDGVQVVEGTPPRRGGAILHVAGRSLDELDTASPVLLVRPDATTLRQATPGPDGPVAVLTTQWPLGERKRATFFRAFYRGLADGLRPSAALRVARDQVRGAPATAHPHHWAGFVLVGGDPGPLPVQAAPRRWGWIAAAVFGVTAIAWVILTRRERRHA